MRKQSRFLVDKFENDIYTINFIVRRTDEISRRQKFKHVNRTVGSNRSVYLCKECDSYLSSERELPVNKSAKKLWPSFIYTTLINKRVTDAYTNKFWKLVPQLWRHWWIDTLPIFNVNYNHITLEYQESIIKDQSSEKEEWKKRH